MPTIQSKKYPDNVQYITSEGWEDFRRLGWDRRWKIIDDSDIRGTVTSTPEVIDFAEPQEILDREAIKAQLDELVENETIEPYNVRAATDKLNKLLKENQ